MLCSFCCSIILDQYRGICCKPAVFLLADGARSWAKKIVCQTLLEIAPKQEKTRLLLVQASTGVNTRICQHTHTIKKQQDIKFSEIEKLLADLIEGRIWHFQQQQQHVCLINQQKKEQKGTTPTLTPQSNGLEKTYIHSIWLTNDLICKCRAKTPQRSEF